MKILDRNSLPDDYKEMMETESHHNHEVVEVNGVIRWKQDPAVNQLVDHMGLNEIVELLYRLGHDKNTEIFRKLYRDMGYSLSGYWEVFYWEANNEEADQYKPPKAQAV